METFGGQPPLWAPASSCQQRLFRKSSTHLAKIAVVLQRAPEKMLTFPQLMDTLRPLMCDNRRSVENNIRVCLSTNKCFVKVPLVPDSQDGKRNYWKLDSSQITPKMVRRHFKGILQLFPELVSKLETETRSRSSEGQASLKGPEAAAGRVQNRREVKFSGPFSIESLLKRDGPSARTSSSSPLSGAQVRAEQQPRFGTKRNFSWDPEEPLLLQTSAGQSPVCSTGGSTHRGLAANLADKRLHVHAEAWWPVSSRTSAAPYFPSPPSSSIRYALPAFTHDALCFCLQFA